MKSLDIKSLVLGALTVMCIGMALGFSFKEEEHGVSWKKYTGTSAPGEKPNTIANVWIHKPSIDIILGEEATGANGEKRTVSHIWVHGQSFVLENPPSEILIDVK